MNHVVALVTFTAIAFFGTATASAKRRLPTAVPPVQNAGVEYRVPHKMLGCVEAWDAAAEKRIWFRQIYVVQRNLTLEGDVQDVFISRMRLDNKRNILAITNEVGGVYSLNLKTLEVKTVKGQAVITKK